MEVRVCKNCRRLFKYIYGPEVCPECTELMKTEKHSKRDKTIGDVLSDKRQTEKGKNESLQLPNEVKPLLKEEEIKFEQVKDYILAHPAATVAEISEANGISPIKLFDWIREERLEFSEDAEFAWFSCESCGAKIKSGRLCNRCKILRKK
jgi:uncharacterized protein